MPRSGSLAAGRPRISPTEESYFEKKKQLLNATAFAVWFAFCFCFRESKVLLSQVRIMQVAGVSISKWQCEPVATPGSIPMEQVLLAFVQ